MSSASARANGTASRVSPMKAADRLESRYVRRAVLARSWCDSSRRLAELVRADHGDGTTSGGWRYGSIDSRIGVV